MSKITAHPQQPLAENPAAFDDPMDLLRRHGIPVLVGVAVAVVVALGITFYKSRAASAERDALLLLASARTLDDLERVTSDFGSTAAAPLAMLKVAHANYASGNYPLAQQKYEALAAQYPKHVMAPAAELGRLHSVEAQGRVAEALTGFEQFAAQHADHFLLPQAVFGQARCLAELGKLTAARVVYEQFMATHPDSAWLRATDEMLDEVNRKIAKGLDGVVPTPAAITTAAAPFIPFESLAAPAQSAVAPSDAPSATPAAPADVAVPEVAVPPAADAQPAPQD